MILTDKMRADYEPSTRARRFGQLRRWVVMCRGWGMVVAHRQAGGYGYPRNQSFGKGGGRGSPSSMPSLADAYIEVDRMICRYGKVGREVLHSYQAWPLLTGRRPITYPHYKKIRLELAELAIKELGL